MHNDWWPRSSMPHTSRPMSSCLEQRARRPAPTLSLATSTVASWPRRPVNSMPPRVSSPCAIFNRERSPPQPGRPQKNCSVVSACPMFSCCINYFLFFLSSFRFHPSASVGLRSFARSACSPPPPALGNKNTLRPTYTCRALVSCFLSIKAASFGASRSY